MYSYFAATVPGIGSRSNMTMIRIKWLLKVKEFMNEHVYDQFEGKEILMSWRSRVCFGQPAEIAEMDNILLQKNVHSWGYYNLILLW